MSQIKRKFNSTDCSAGLLRGRQGNEILAGTTDQGPSTAICRETMILLLIVHSLFGIFRIRFGRELDEAEASTPPCVAVLDDGLQECEKSQVRQRPRGILTASSMLPNSENFARRVSSSVCHARPLVFAVSAFGSKSSTR